VLPLLLVAHPLPLLQLLRQVERLPLCVPRQASSNDQPLPVLLVLLHLQQVQEPLSSAGLPSPRAAAPSTATGMIPVRIQPTLYSRLNSYLLFVQLRFTLQAQHLLLRMACLQVLTNITSESFAIPTLGQKPRRPDPHPKCPP
jgi:hypothetical protein